jgi:predicted transcriptional regulator
MSANPTNPNVVVHGHAPEPDGATVYISIAEKWQGAVTKGSGFVAIPMALLRLQTKLKLSQTDMMVLINLLAHWWDPARAVFPRSSTIAKRLGVTKRTVQRSTQKLLDSGLIVREFLDDGKRVFYFDPLATRLAKDIGLSLELKGQESLDA